MAKRYSQPQGNARIDWANPTSKGLAFAWDAAAKSRELTAGLSAGLNQTSSAVNRNGLAAQCSSGQKNIEWNKQFITTSDGTGGGDFTMLVVADPAATGAGSVEHVFDQKNDAAGAPYAQVGLLAHSGARGAYTSGAFSFFTYRSTDSEVSAAGACDGLEHVWIGVRRAGTLYLYKDGVLLASGAGFGGSLNISQASRYTAVGSAGNATAGAYRNKASMARAWNRALSAAEIAEQTSLARFSLYQPQARIWVPVAAGGDTYTLTADSGSFALTGQDTALNFNRTLSADSGSFALTGQDAALTFNRTLAADSGSFALTGQDTALNFNRTLAADSGSFALTGQDAALTFNRALVADSGSFALAGQDATPTFSRVLSAASGSYALAGQDATLTFSRVLSAASGSYALAGQDATLTYTPISGATYTLAAASGSFALAGQGAVLLQNRSLAADSGSFALTGQDATLARGYMMPAQSGDYSVAGQDAALIASRRLAADSAAFALAGQNADLTYTPITGNTYTLSASSGSFVLTGQDAQLLQNRALAADAATYALAGQSATLTYSGGVSAIYPSPSVVLFGTAYGPTGTEYTGTFAVPSAADITIAVLAALNATTIPVDTKKMNGAAVLGNGTSGNQWRGA